MTVPCTPLSDKASRHEHTQAAARAFAGDPYSLETAGSPVQAAQSPKDVNKVLVRIPSHARFPSMVRSRPSRSGCPAKPLLCFRDIPCHPTGFVERLAYSGDVKEGHNHASVANHLFAARVAVPHRPLWCCSSP